MKRKISKLYFGNDMYRYIVEYKKHWWSRWHYVMDGKYPRLFLADELISLKEE